MPRLSPRGAALALIALTTGAGCLAAACSDEGTTPKCPDLPLYDVNDASPADKEARAAAANAGCVTGPGTATTGTATPNDSGAGD